ncbi:MAG: YncE family protein [Pseudoalteromonas prydzensis]|uniref:YncE family protein n=1 Tax=Pseudoalteromonas prydzensis TaxID=182141 RepID=UPI003F99C5D7
MKTFKSGATTQSIHAQSMTSKLCLSALTLAILFSLSGCDGDDGSDGTAGIQGTAGVAGSNGTDGADGSDGSDGTDGVDGATGFAAATFILANNGADNAGTIDLIDQNAAKLKTFNSGANEGVAFDSLGNLIQASDSGNGALSTVCQVLSREDGTMFDSNRDRTITGSNTTLANPKGIHVSTKRGLIFAADFNAMQITVFGATAAGDAAPLASTVTDAKPWDVTYDDTNDRLYVALTNGDVTVYDNYVDGGFMAMPTRTITPSNAAGEKISVNIHGIVYDANTNKLVLSDVGSASDATDGALFVINNASLADGNTTVARSIAGPASMLGNPVDISLTGSDLRVAEKSNDAVLVFSNIFSGASGDISPDSVTATIKPESITETVMHNDMADVSDSYLANMPLMGIAVSSNPGAAGPTTGQISRLNAPLTSELGSYNASQTIESVTFDKAGNSYTTFDNSTTSTGGIVISNKVAMHRDGEVFTLSQDSIISGANTGLISPKGLDVASDSGLIFVAENNATTPSIVVFSTCTTGDASPLITLTASNSARPWDVDYDVATDRAFVALTNGTIAVFDEVKSKLMARMSTITGEDRLITPATAGAAFPAPSNIHGIDYDPLSDSLIVSDVGSAADATDGKIFVLNNAGTSSGLSNVSVNIAGPATMLGNPVDIMFTGNHLYVAEKSNGLVMRFDNILNSPGGDIAANLSYSFTAPESVAILPTWLNR